MGKISSTAGNKIISKIITEVNVEMIDLTKEINISENNLLKYTHTIMRKKITTQITVSFSTHLWLE